MATDQVEQVDHVDTLCKGLLRAGRSQASRADTLFYSSIILERVEELLPLVEDACARWPDTYPERRAAETQILETQEAMVLMQEMLEAAPAPPTGGALYPDRTTQPASTDTAGADQVCKQLARAQQALKQHHIMLRRSRPGEL